MSASGGTAAATAPTSANILAGFATLTANGTTTLITVPAGRTWVGQVGVSCAVNQAGAGTATGLADASIGTANGTGTVVPAAGSYVQVRAEAGANVAGGTVGTQDSTAVAGQRLVVVAPAGGTALVQVTLANAAGVNPFAAGWAIGELQ